MLEVLSGSSAEFFSWGSQDATFKVDGEACDIKKFLVDPTSIRTGFGKLEKGSAPDWVWAEVAGTRIQKPSEEHKPAFSVLVYVTKDGGSPAEGYRDWQSNARAAREAIQSVWKEVHDGAAKNADKLAIIEVTGKRAEQVGPARINVPVLKVAGWAAKPGEAPAKKKNAGADLF